MRGHITAGWKGSRRRLKNSHLVSWCVRKIGMLDYRGRDVDCGLRDLREP